MRCFDEVNEQIAIEIMSKWIENECLLKKNKV